MSGSSEAKKHAASELKLRKQREKGSVASSQESSGLLACALGLALILGTAGLIWAQLQVMITSMFDLVELPFDVAHKIAMDALSRTVLITILPIVALVAASAFIVAVLFNRGMLFSLQPVTPKFSRLSPVSGFKRIYGRRGWIETFVSTLRLIVWIIFAILIGFLPFAFIVGNGNCTGGCMAEQLAPLFRNLTITAILLLLISAAIEMLMQKRLFLHEQKMTETERKRERKDQFGVPEIREERRRRMREANYPKRTPNLKNATMCFYSGNCAIAVEFRPPEVPVPYIVGKADTAADALRLRQTVRRAGWPEDENELLTRVGLRTAEGTVLAEHAFEAFIQAVRKMFES